MKGYESSNDAGLVDAVQIFSEIRAATDWAQAPSYASLISSQSFEALFVVHRDEI